MSAVNVEFCRNALQLGTGLLLQSSLLLALGLAAGWLLRRRGPAFRAFVCQATLAGVALGAVLSVCVAGRVQPLWSVHLGTPPARLGSPPPRSGEDKRSARYGEVQVTSASSLASLLPFSSPTRNGEGGRGTRPGGVSLKGEAPSPTVTQQAPAPPASPYPFLAALWAAVAGLLLLWLVVCQTHLTRLRRSARPITEGRAAETLASLALPVPALLSSPFVRSPFLAGLRRPAIFLPSTWEADFDGATLHAVLAHELAHLKRRDCAWTLLLRLTSAVLWPQPLLWLLARQLDQATEEACDLLALTPDCPPRRYADCLLRLADCFPPSRRERALGAGITPIRSSLGRRIQNVLDRRYYTMMPISTRLCVAAMLGTSIIAAGLSLAFASSQDGPVSKQMTSNPGSASAQAGSPQGGLSNANGGEKRSMYGIVWGPFPKHMQGHRMGYFLNSMRGSPAAQAGIPTQPQSVLISINGHLAKGSPTVVAALFRLPPPLLITYVNAAGQTRQAILRSKAMISVPPLNSLSMLLTRKKMEHENYTTARYWLAVLDKQLHEEVSRALSSPTSPSPQTLKRVVLLEYEISARGNSIGTLEQAIKEKSRQKPKDGMRLRSEEQQEQEKLRPLLEQEAQLFPQTEQTRHRLKDIHTLAVRADRESLTMTMHFAQTQAINSMIENVQRKTRQRPTP